MRVSFVIPAHNEERLLGRTLSALHAAAAEVIGAGRYEVIVVDDDSTDRTGGVASEFVAQGTRVLRVNKRQISAVRNAGAQAAAGDILIFVDADTCINADVLRAALRAIENGAVGGGAGIDFDGEMSWLVRLLVETMVVLFRVAKTTGGCFIFCTKQAYAKVGGWDETLYAGEELVLCRAFRRIGKFVILRERVLTSGRKIRAYSMWEILWLCVKAAFRGKRMLRKREGLELWYQRREEDAPRV